MSMAQNTMNFAEILSLSDQEICDMAEEHLEVEQNAEVEEILNNFNGKLNEDDKECLAQFIVDCQNLMPN